MACQITNNSNLDISGFEDTIQQLVSFSQDRFGFEKPPALFLNSDPSNAANPLGKTAYYDPEAQEIHIYVDERHPKDIMRSISHELIHHVQNLRGDLSGNHYHGEGYAQKDKHMREMEREAYEEGNMCFRDFEDLKRENKTTYNEWRTNKMSLKEWKNNELFTLLSDKWGFGKNVITEEKEITHMCALKVTHKESGQVGHPYKHTLTESGDISHYSVEFNDVLVENIAVEDLDIMVQAEHMHAKNDDKPHAKDKPVVSEEELGEMHCPSGKKDDELNEEPKDPLGLRAYLIKKGVSKEKLDSMTEKEMDAMAAMKRRAGGEEDVAQVEEEKKEHPLDVAPPHTGRPDAKDFAKLRKDKKDKEAVDEEMTLDVDSEKNVPASEMDELDEMHCPSGKKEEDMNEGMKDIHTEIENMLNDGKSVDEIVAALDVSKDDVDGVKQDMKSAKNEQLKESMRKRFARLIR
jgi:hypothetical protein